MIREVALTGPEAPEWRSRAASSVPLPPGAGTELDLDCVAQLRDRFGPGVSAMFLVGFWATEGAQSEADVKKFEAALWRPPVGVAPTRGPWSPGEENRAFASLKAALGK